MIPRIYAMTFIKEPCPNLYHKCLPNLAWKMLRAKMPLPVCNNVNSIWMRVNTQMVTAAACLIWEKPWAPEANLSSAKFLPAYSFCSIVAWRHTASEIKRPQYLSLVHFSGNHSLCVCVSFCDFDEEVPQPGEEVEVVRRYPPSPIDTKPKAQQPQPTQTNRLFWWVTISW